MVSIKVLIAGGTGFIGNALVRHLVDNGCEVAVLSRTKREPKPHVSYFLWDVDRRYVDNDAFTGVDVVINLAGAGIAEKNWTDDRKKEIINSRVVSTQLLYKTISDRKIPIKTYISASAVGYYGVKTTEHIYTEDAPNGTDFLAAVCKEWEDAAHAFNDLGIRTVILRQGVVIGQGEGILKKMTPLAKLGINVALGSGKQYMPWIAIFDLLRIYETALSSNDFQGVYNAVAPQHISMNTFSEQLLASYQKKSFLPNVPSFAIKLAFGEMSCMLLEGSRVSAEKICNIPFVFKYPTIKQAFDHCSLI